MGVSVGEEEAGPTHLLRKVREVFHVRCESVLLLSLLVGPAQTGPSPMLRKRLTGKGAI